jgi:predicted ATPase
MASFFEQSPFIILLHTLMKWMTQVLRSLHQQSHGESFLSLFLHRFRGRAIYLLDEPEAALSPQRQLIFLKVLHNLTTNAEYQFIIATHSPILLGFPHATILSFDDGKIREVDYEMTDHYQITKYFLLHREKLLKGREIYSEKMGIFSLISFLFSKIYLKNIDLPSCPISVYRNQL